MKKLTILAAFMLLATASVIAQTEKTTVIIKETDEGKETTTIVEKFFTSRLQQTLPDLYYGYLNLCNEPFGPEANIPLRSSAFEWGTYNQHTIFCTKGGHFGMTWGFGISNSYNLFSHDKVFVVGIDPNDENKAGFMLLSDYSKSTDEGGLGHGPENNYAHRSYLRYWSLRLPLMVQAQCNINGTPLALAAGVEAEWRFGVRSFARYGGSKHTIANNFDYNPLGLNAIVSLAGDDGVLFARMGLTEFMQAYDSDGNFKDLYQVSIGFGFNFD